MQKVLHEESPLRLSECINSVYSVKVPLKLVTDSQGRTFV